MATLTNFADFLNDFLAEAKEVAKAPEALTEATDLKVGDYFIPHRREGYGQVTKVGSRDVKYKSFDKEGHESQQGEGRINHEKDETGTKIDVHPAEHAANMKAGAAEAHAKGLKPVDNYSDTYYHDGKHVVATHDKKTGKLVSLDHTKEADEELKKPFKEGSLEDHRRLRDLHNKAASAHRELARKAWSADGVDDNHRNIANQHDKRSEEHAEAAARKYKESQMAQGEHPLDADLKRNGSTQSSEQRKLGDAHTAAAKFHTERGNKTMADAHEARASKHYALASAEEAHAKARAALDNEIPSRQK